MATTRVIDTDNDVWHADYRRVLEAAGMEAPAVIYASRGELVLFAYHDDAVVGVASGRVQRYEPYAFNERFGAFAELRPPQAMLDKVAVVPEARGQGLGRLLMKSFALAMQDEGCTHVALQVDWSTDRESRLRFFSGCGLSSLIENSDDDLLGAEITTVLQQVA